MAFDAGAVIGSLELDIAGWKKSVETVKKDQTSLSGLVMRHEKQFKSFGKAIALAGGAVVASFGAMVIKSANAGDAINDMSQRTGIATDILSGHKLALDKSGSSLEGFAVGMRGLSRVMDDANKGGKESQEIFADLGVSYADNEGKLRPLNDVLLDAAERFAQMQDGPEKAALSMKVFGRSGMELIPMLNMGKQGLIDNYEATRKLGGLWSKEAAQAADKFNDSIAGVKMAGAGLAKEIGSILMPSSRSSGSSPGSPSRSGSGPSSIRAWPRAWSRPPRGSASWLRRSGPCSSPCHPWSSISKFSRPCPQRRSSSRS
jgi:hypothetical protein